MNKIFEFSKKLGFIIDHNSTLEKVYKAFEKECPEGDNDFTKGYKQAIEDLKREIYE